MSVLALVFGVVLAQSPRSRSHQVLPRTSQAAPGKENGLTAKLEPFEGWTDAYKITNGVVELVAVPKIGRIVRFGFVGGENVLWLNADWKGKDPDRAGKEYAEFGGDKLWIAPRSMWDWPPPADIDTGPYVGTPMPGGLKLVGPKNARFGIHMEREITLGAKGAEVRILDRIVNDAPFTLRRSVWQVTQVESPDEVTVGLHPSKAWPLGYLADGAASEAQAQGSLLSLRPGGKAATIGAASPDGTVTVHRGNVTFTLSARYEGRGAYPDDGAAQKIGLLENKNAEIGLLSPILTLRPQESREFVVTWRLSKPGELPKPVSPTPRNTSTSEHRRNP